MSEVSHEALEMMRRRYFVNDAEFEPKVYYRITDNWVELTVRFVVNERGVRGVKDQMNREILAALDEAGIGIASGTYEIVGLPQVRVITENSKGVGRARRSALHPAVSLAKDDNPRDRRQYFAVNHDIVGIDLGTTNSLIGVMEAGFPILLADATARVSRRRSCIFPRTASRSSARRQPRMRASQPRPPFIPSNA